MGPYSSFDSCVATQRQRGRSEESARKVCGAIKRDVEGSEALPTDAVAQDAQRRLIESSGMPFPIAEDKQFTVSRLFATGESRAYEKSVPVSLLTATQRDFDADKVIEMMGDESPDPIAVVKLNNRYVIDDGHHRAMAAKYRGDGTVPARVVEA